MEFCNDHGSGDRWVRSFFFQGALSRDTVLEEVARQGEPWVCQQVQRREERQFELSAHARVSKRDGFGREERGDFLAQKRSEYEFLS